MDIFSVATLLGGLAFFLFGMSHMSTNLEKLSGSKMESVVQRMTSNRFKGLLCGLFITVAIQSSSAVTVMLVGLVNSGLMQIANTVGVIMGSNVGTTVTAWIMSLIGLSSDNVFVRMLKPETFAPVMAFIGILLVMMGKKEIQKNVGSIMLGFAVLMYGMTLMSGAVAPLADSPKFSAVMTAFDNPLLGILVGIAVTAVIQSSSASVGILQALSMTGAISYGIAIPIIMGQNIGTCVTAVLSTLGVSRNAKRVAVIHIAFNLIGTAVFLLLFYGAHALLGFGFLEEAIGPAGIALFHTVFNVGTTLLLLPFAGRLVKLAMRAVKEEPERQVAFMDERLFETPAFAVAQCRRLAMEMADLVGDTIGLAIGNLHTFDEEAGEKVRQMEEDADIYEDHLGGYLVRLSGTELSEEDKKNVGIILDSISDWERISDHALNLEESAEELEGKGLELSPAAMEELAVLEGAVSEIVGLVRSAYTEKDAPTRNALAKKVEPLEEVVDTLTDEIKRRHIMRLQTGECTIEKGFILTDILTDYERISDHCSNIALALLGEMDEAHDYADRIKRGNDEAFTESFMEYRDKYAI